MKKLTPRQKKIAKAAGNPNKIEASDFKALKRKKNGNKGKNKKSNKICSAGIAWAKRTFDTYPSAYANMAASKYCKDPNYAKGKKKK